MSDPQLLDGDQLDVRVSDRRERWLGDGVVGHRWTLEGMVRAAG